MALGELVPSVTERRSSLRASANFSGTVACSVEMVRLTLVYHHGGSIVTKNNGSVVYEVDNIEELEQLDKDTLDVFAVRDHHFALGYEKIAKCSWLVLGSLLDIGLRPITIDVKLLEMCRATRGNHNMVHIYYEHVISVPQVEEDVPELIEFTPNSVTVQESQNLMANTPSKPTPSQHISSKSSKFKTVLPKSPQKTKPRQSKAKLIIRPEKPKQLPTHMPKPNLPLSLPPLHKPKPNPPLSPPLLHNLKPNLPPSPQISQHQSPLKNPQLRSFHPQGNHQE
ncbi:hypothetical protein PIB30_047694 [Stylosanthes scabra]|uniref:PB1-like domain-containing protein n=1 Tax=Stylosanthes scabra TaxID=79078 RepID=A0ABU6QH17_9FABA|nr:hypothetical protein [Stylosanthes scabra]